MSNSRALEDTIVRLLRQRPFYGHFLLNLRREETTGSNKPAGITVRDGIPLISLNNAGFTGLTSVEQEALLEHLVKHLLHLHPVRGKGLNRHDWDIACDLAINPSIKGLPPEALFPAAYKMPDGLAAEEYYQALVPPFDTGNLEGSGFGDAQQDQQGAAGAGLGDAEGTPLDDHSIWSQSDSTPAALAEEMVRSITRDAVRGCDGDTPADLRPVVAALLQPSPIPWRQILRQFVATAGRTGKTSSWMREHRRFGHDTPGIRKRHRLNLLVGVDVSDSTNSTELREAFARELISLARGRESRLTVLYANSRIQRIQQFTGTNLVCEVYQGGGFTDLRPVFDYARSMKPLPAAVIYLTDGIGPVPEQMEFPTLWVLTGAGEKPAPWGVELRMES